jgi:hypothetical protein
MTRVSRAEAAETLREQCLRPVDEREGSYPPDHLQALEALNDRWDKAVADSPDQPSWRT